MGQYRPNGTSSYVCNNGKWDKCATNVCVHCEVVGMIKALPTYVILLLASRIIVL